ncbi:Hypp377 [Branchiostoma lanceolatum]|uniref:Hypp377 protein n=1 Tax=Branchiostoma lanceolatum TaxID=7740 RepID=A0A8J9YND6_BRALA|nr:Hypp377 [Branchiostoma lanceolatum]
MVKRGFFRLLLLLHVAVLCRTGLAHDQEDEKEWFTKNFCDDGEHMLEVDWDGSDVEHTCPERTWPDLSKKEIDVSPIEECHEVKDKAWHSCLTDGTIDYPDRIPTSGKHRPVAPAYGDYIYIPPQRWVHALEHGAAVFLYHPCASSAQVQKLKRLARGCLRRHIITPYRKLEPTRVQPKPRCPQPRIELGTCWPSNVHPRLNRGLRVSN